MMHEEPDMTDFNDLGKGYRPDRDWNLLWVVPLLLIPTVALIVSFVVYDNTHGRPTAWPFLRLFVLIALIGFIGFVLVLFVRAVVMKKFQPAIGWAIIVAVAVAILIWLLSTASVF